MLIELITTWTIQGTGGGGNVATGQGIAFDTDTKQVVPFNASRNQAILDPKPADMHLPAGFYLWFECAGTTQTKWFFDGVGATYTTVIFDSTECGWAPPAAPAPTCDLVLHVVVRGDTITATTSGAHGRVTYSRDGGTTRQVSGTFGPLPPKAYVITAYDDGPSDCYRSQTVFVLAAVPTALPLADALPALGFSRNPLALLVTATQPGRDLLVELWAESAHGSGQYQRLVQRVRPTDDAGQAVLQLQDQLHAVLTPERPDLTRPAGLVRLTSVIRRYYAAVAEVQPATGLPGPFVFQPASTVLRGGLPWALARAGTYFNPLPAGLLSWRPGLAEQVVGAGHVALLSHLLPASTEQAQAQVRCYARGISTPFTTLGYTLPLLAGSVIESEALSLLRVPSPYLVQLQLPFDELPDDTYRVEVDFLADGVRQPGRGRYRLAAGTCRHFIFLNSLGQWDTLSCPGPLTSKTSTDRTVATRLLPADYDAQDGPDSVVAVAVDTKMSVSSSRR